ncbi:SRPBCC family protein [Oceanobacillus kapialis]|uniref:SRPBCC domain-containing protein n=1 Tax=Oceanobacillus kapialis TaxID=481353 RepID=A0ABW5Q4N3_9BACI
MSLQVRDTVTIDSPAAKVWEVLVNPVYVKRWDELPEDYPQDRMKLGDKVVWDLPNGQQSITKLIKTEPNKELVIALMVTTWEHQPEEGDVSYRYIFEEGDNQTVLHITIGDFSPIKDGEMYYEESVKFAEESKKVIKELAENL